MQNLVSFRLWRGKDRLVLVAVMLSSLLLYCPSIEASEQEPHARDAGMEVRRLRYIGAGIGPTAGLTGIEAYWISAERRTAYSVGAGRAGAGARTMVFFDRSPRGPEGARHYLAAGYLLTPWKSGTIDAPGALLFELGRLMLRPDERYLMDMGIGLSVVTGGDWGGNTAGIVLRLQVGIPIGRQGRESGGG